jgi:toxin CcdB
MRFDVYTPPRPSRAAFLVEVQSDFVSDLPTKMVIPLVLRENYRSPIKELHPILEIAGQLHVLLTHEVGSVQKKQLQRPVGSLMAYRDEITRALDLLFTGF